MTVYDRAIERLDFIFDRFDNIYIAFSGGKDSGVLLNLVADYMRDRGIQRRVGLYHMDYEAQYQQVTDYVERTLAAQRARFDIYHVCMPICAQSAVSMTQGYWVPWEAAKRELWVRDMPMNDDVIHEDNQDFGFWRTGMTDYEFQMNFAPWYQEQRGGGRTIVLTGIRAQESHVRYMRSKTLINKFEGREFVLEMANGTYQGFPIHDWITEDIWAANARFGWDYNEIYDLYYYAGLSIDQMRVASPFNDAATATLKPRSTDRLFDVS